MKGTVAIREASSSAGDPCAECPWRTANHGKRHPGGFYRKDNLRRLWNQIRKGGGVQTCHPTDPGHPDHQEYAGAREGSTAQECMGSIVLITRELRHAARLSGSETTVEPEGATKYLAENRVRRGLTLEGLLWTAFQRRLPPPLGLGQEISTVPERLVDAEWIGRPDEPQRQTGTPD